jgi:signal peptidase II
MIALAVVGIDQASKVAVREFLLSRGTNSVPVFGEWVRITYVENAGAAFGLLQNQTFLFILIGAIVVTGILFGHRFLPTHKATMALCLGLQLGGASGNLIDRLRHDGHVFDFIHVGSFPVFNVADSAIVVGVIILAYHLLFTTTRTQLEGSDSGQ